jgi:hypothetical protein
MSHAGSSGRSRPVPGWPVLLALCLGIGVLAAGVVWTANTLLRGAETTVQEPSRQVTDVRSDAHSPAYYGLPVYPGSFGFISQEQDLDGVRAGSGSVSFRSKKDDIDDMLRFYERKLAETKWALEWKSDTPQKKTDDPHVKPIPAWRARWSHPTRKRQLTLLAVEDPQPAWKMQGVLSWVVEGQDAPAPTSGKVPSSGGK